MKYLPILLTAFFLFNGSLTLADTNDQPVFDKMLSQFIYPFEVSNFELSSQNQELKMGYMDIGNSGSNKVIVLLHGKNFSGYYWERIAKDLAAQEFRVIIPDQIGFGKSSKPEYYQYSFSQLALNTQSLLKSLKIRNYTLVGHSMGGMLATQMAYLFPESLNKLVLINPIGLESYLDYAQFKDTDFFYKRELAKNIDKARAYQKKNYYDGKWNDGYEKLLTPLKGWLNGPDWQRVAWNNALTYHPIFSEDMTAKFSKLNTKTYFIIGTRDRTGPGRGWKKEGIDYKFGQYQHLGKAAQQLVKDSELIELEGLGHMPQFEDYDRFSNAFNPILK